MGASTVKKFSPRTAAGKGGKMIDLETSSPVIATFLRNYNDCVDDTVRQSLKPFIPRLANSRGTDAVEKQRSMLALDWLIRVHTAEWLKAAGLTQHADNLAKAARFKTGEDAKNILPTLVAARAAARAATAKDAAWDAWDAARDVLKPTVLLVQATVPDLLNRMLALTEGGFAQ